MYGMNFDLKASFVYRYPVLSRLSTVEYWSFKIIAKIKNMAEEDIAKTKEACSGLKAQLISCMKESECMLKVINITTEYKKKT